MNLLSVAETNDAQRIFHGRGKLYPEFSHITIDLLPPVCLITLYDEVADDWLRLLAQDLNNSFEQCTSVQVQYRCRYRAPVEVLSGECVSQFTIAENNLHYQIQLGQSQNHGLFLDMKNGRQWVREHAKDKSILNLFAYTCGFSVVAIEGGARQVVNVDNSRAPLTRGRDNHRLNKHDLRDVRFEAVDIFKSFGRLNKLGPYDIVVCDPPTFQKGSVDIEKDYSKIMRRLPQLLNSKGYALICLNSPYLGLDFIHKNMREACPQLQFIERIHAPEVYQDIDAEKGLKMLVFQIA